MEVISDNCALLSNFEVLTLLKEIKEKQKQLKHCKGLATIAYESIKYLEDSPVNDQTSQSVRLFLTEIKDKFRLTKAEKLQIVNQRPVTLVELQLLIEENEERFSEEAMQQLLDTVKSHLIPDNGQGNDEDGDDENEDNDENDGDDDDDDDDGDYVTCDGSSETHRIKENQNDDV